MSKWWNKVADLLVLFECSVTSQYSGLETTVFHVCGLLVCDISFMFCTFWKLTLITLNSLWNNFGHVLIIEICSVLSGRGCWRMWYTIYENWPHRRHFTVHCLQWSITFLTEYTCTCTYTKYHQKCNFSTLFIIRIYVIYNEGILAVFFFFFFLCPKEKENVWNYSC